MRIPSRIIHSRFRIMIIVLFKLAALEVANPLLTWFLLALPQNVNSLTKQLL